MTDPVAIEQLNALVARVEAIRDHVATVRRTSIASLHTPNFVLVESEPVFPEPMLIPQPIPPAPPKLSAGRIVLGSIGAAISIGCFMLAMVQT